MAALTDKAVQAAKAEGGARDLADGTVPGLYLRVLPSGRKSWTLRLRVAGRNVRLDAGTYPDTGLGEARDLARAARKLAERGGDPEHAIRPPAPPAGATVKEAVARWLSSKTGNRSLPMERRRFELHVEPVLGERQVRDITRAELAELLHDIAFRAKSPAPVEANRVFTSLRGFFAWAQAMDLRPDDPTALLKRPLKVEPSAIRMKEETEPMLDTTELARVWNAAPALPGAVLRDLVRCMLLAPLRREEWTAAAWAELRDPFTADGWSGAALCIPAARMKGRRPATVPLPRQALAILEARRKLTGRGDHIFAVPGRDAAFAGWKRGAETLREALPGSSKNWSPHTIRKSVATAMVRDLAADELLVGRLLQHSPKNALGVTNVYQRSARLAEQAALLTRWADHLEAVAARLLEEPGQADPRVAVLPRWQRAGGSDV